MCIMFELCDKVMRKGSYALGCSHRPAGVMFLNRTYAIFCRLLAPAYTMLSRFSSLKTLPGLMGRSAAVRCLNISFCFALPLWCDAAIPHVVIALFFLAETQSR